MKISESSVKAGELTLALKSWGEPDKTTILALHGWQDNAASFDQLAPHFPEYYWLAPDLPGHGNSEHRGIGSEYTIWSYCTEVMALANALDLDKFILLGHSMGGGIANLLAALFPDRIRALILLDVIGIITTPAEDTVTQMSTALGKRLAQHKRQPGFYATKQEAIAARAKKDITYEAAALLAERGICSHEKGFYWGHDQRLTGKNLLSMTDAQMAPFLSAVSCPVLLLTSKEAVVRKGAIKRRSDLFSNIQVVNLRGGHHQHLDGDVEAVGAAIRNYLVENVVPS